jgi:hypothetical protein
LLRNGHVPGEPAMTPLEYSERYAKWHRASVWYVGGYLATFLAVCLTGVVAADSHWLPVFLGNIILYSTVFCVPLFVVFAGRFRRQVAAKYELACPTCGASIVDGEHGVGDDGYLLCSNCGRRLVLASDMPPNTAMEPTARI